MNENEKPYHGVFKPQELHNPGPPYPQAYPQPYPQNYAALSPSSDPQEFNIVLSHGRARVSVPSTLSPQDKKAVQRCLDALPVTAPDIEPPSER